MRKNLIFICIIGAILTIAIYARFPGPPKNDFLAYWSASHLLVTGGNPYDHAQLRNLEIATIPEISSQGEVFLNTWNPPWLLLIFTPLGLLPYLIASLVWTFCNILLIGLVILISWRMYAGSGESRGILMAFLAGFLFGETISYLAIGQITALVLIGMILAIWFIEHRLDLPAGAILLLTTIKPQISYYFLLIILVWIIQNRRWLIIVGSIISALFFLIIFWIIEPDWVGSYITLLTSMPYSAIYTSTFGSFMASIFNIKIFYLSALLLLVPIKRILAILKNDGWLTAMNISLIISLPLSPFGFNFDQILILPAIVQIVAWTWMHQFPTKNARTIIILLVLFYALVFWMLSMNPLENYWFFIIPVIFLPIYLLSWKFSYGAQKTSYGS
jgi:hypothetical protein